MERLLDQNMEITLAPFEEKFLDLKPYISKLVETKTFSGKGLTLLTNVNFSKEKEEKVYISDVKNWFQCGLLKDLEIASLQWRGQEKCQKVKQHLSCYKTNGVLTVSLRFIYQIKLKTKLLYILCETIVLFPEATIGNMRIKLRPFMSAINVLYEEGNFFSLLEAKASPEDNLYCLNEKEQQICLFQELQLVLEKLQEEKMADQYAIFIPMGNEKIYPIPKREWKKGIHGIRNIL